MNPEREAITGTVCGVRVEEVEEPLMREIGTLDKLVDELAGGKAMRRLCGRGEGARVTPSYSVNQAVVRSCDNS